jgi:tetratricopeptide (TPR) repeat protein
VKTGFSSAAETVSVHRAAAIQEVLKTLRTHIERARAAYWDNDSGKAWEHSEKIAGGFSPLLKEQADGEEIISRAVLVGAALSILGRLAEKQGKPDEAHKYFGQAAGLFESELKNPSESLAFYWVDYSVALARLGSGKLQEALGNALLALDCLAQVSPDDVILFLTKAEAHGLAQDTNRAAAAWERAARALARQGRFETARFWLDRAMQAPPGRDRLRVRAEALLLLGNAAESLALLEPEIESSSPDPRCLLLYAGALSVLGRLDEAIDKARQATQIDPGRVEPWLALADLLAQRRRYPEAVETLERAREHVNSVQLLAFQGEMHRTMKQFDQALAALDAALQIEPEHGYALGVKGLVLWALDRREESLAALEHALTVQPDYAWLYTELAWGYFEAGQPDRALETVERGLAVNGRTAALWQAKGDLLRFARRYEEAVAAFDRALSLDKNLTAASVGRGQALIAMPGRIEDAVRALQSALEAEPGLHAARLALAEAFRRQRRYDDMLAQAQEALKDQPDEAQAMRLKGEALTLLGRCGEASEHFDAVLRSDSDNALALGGKGRVLRLQRRIDESRTALERAVELDGGRDWLFAELAETCRASGDYESALAAAERALSLNPDTALALCVKGRVLEVQRRPTEALAALERSLALERSAGALCGKGLVFLAGGQYSEAWDVLVEGAGLERRNLDILRARAALLCDIGEYSRTIRLLEDAVDFAASESWYYFFLGWTNENHESGARLEQALDAYREAWRREPENIWSRSGVGNCLRLLGKREEAAEIYSIVSKEVLAQSGRLDPLLLSLVGWCHLWAGRPDEAIQFLAAALKQSDDVTHAQFDLALALLCSDRAEIAHHEYQRGIEMTKAKPPLRRRGLLTVALRDLEGIEAASTVQLTGLRECTELLTKEVATLPRPEFLEDRAVSR